MSNGNHFCNASTHKDIFSKIPSFIHYIHAERNDYIDGRKCRYLMERLPECPSKRTCFILSSSTSKLRVNNKLELLCHYNTISSQLLSKLFL